MSAEERWADRMEWENERGELEIDSVRNAEPGLICEVKTCGGPAASIYKVVECGRQFSGLSFAFCEEDATAETAFRLYERYQGAD